MPYKSVAQVGYLHAKVPDVAERWDRKYGVPKGLPKKLAKKRRERRASEPPDRLDQGERVMP